MASVSSLAQLESSMRERFGDRLTALYQQDMLTVELPAKELVNVCRALRDEDPFRFEQLIDVCGVDYAEYGISEWRTTEATGVGFDRAVEPLAEQVQKKPQEKSQEKSWSKPRYAAVYHLLSVTYRHRMRLKVFLEPEPSVPSVIDIWPSANWFEREAFDLFGIVFDNHPDLRRLLTDYGFKGHPFRRDFPLIGEVEMRYDAAQKRCVYEPVSIQPRVLVPKVIRDDNRYADLGDNND